MRIAIAAILLGAATMAVGPFGPAAGKTRPEYTKVFSIVVVDPRARGR